MIVFQSCSYYWTTVKDVNGKEHRIKEYKNPEVYQRKVIEYRFKHPKRKQTYSSYAGTLKWDTIHKSTFIQFDSVRVYLFDDANDYKSIFTSGLVSGQMIYCVLDSTCRPTPEWQIRDTKTNELRTVDLWGWTGYTINIGHMEEIKRPQPDKRKRRFLFRVTTSGMFTGGVILFWS